MSDSASDADIRRARTALTAAEVGIWDWTVATGELVWDETIACLHGVDPRTFDGTMEAFLTRVHPDDRAGLEDAIGEAVAVGGSFLTEFRVVLPSGETRWIQGRGAALTGTSGATERMIGLGMDTTELRNQRERAGRSIEFASDGLVILDPDWKVAFANPAAARIFERAAHDLVGIQIWEAFPHAVGGEFWTRLTTAAETLQPARFRSHYSALDGWFELDVFPAPDGLTIFFRRVDEQIEIEEERERLVKQLEVTVLRERQLQEITARLADALSVSEVARTILASARRALDTSFAGIGLVDETGTMLEFVNAERLPEETRDSWGTVPLTVDAPITVAARTGTSFFHETTDELLADFPALRDDAGRAGRGAFATVPLRSGGTPIGVLALSWPTPRELSEGDRDFLAAVSGLCAQAVARAQMIERERTTARLVQQAILPELRNALGEVRCAGRYLPAEWGIEVGGDWYDAFTLPDGAVAITIGDVAGHGLTAASTMAELRNMLRAYAFEGRAPAEVLGRLDSVLTATGSEQFATCFHAHYDPSARELTFANAGHPSPVLLVPGRAPRLLQAATGPLLGAGGAPTEERLVLPPGTRLLLYTDGLVESRSRPVHEGIRAVVRDLAKGTPRDLQALCDRVLRNARAARREDDVCVLVVDFGGARRRRRRRRSRA